MASELGWALMGLKMVTQASVFAFEVVPTDLGMGSATAKAAAKALAFLALGRKQKK